MVFPDDDIQIEVSHAAGQPIEHAAHNWGMVLADVVRHISYCYQKTDGTDTELMRERILHYLGEDLTNPDPEHTEGYLKRGDEPGG